MRVAPRGMQQMRELAGRVMRIAGMQRAASAGMVPRNESWTIPFIVIEWTVIAVGLIMAMAVFLMN